MLKQVTCILLGLLLIYGNLKAQVPTYRFDEGQLSSGPGTTIVSDPSANAGSAFYRSSTSGDATFWYGPYTHLPAGNYVMQVRLKVNTNSSELRVLTIDVNNGDNGYVFKSLQIRPSMFKQNNEWQLFSMPFQIPESIGQLELRGLSFHSGLTDIYMDYVNIVPDYTKGYYSDDLTIDGNGNIGIHTAAPKEALSVNGNIRARQIKVETDNWPDYVFKPTYKLPSLNTVKAYIDKNKHLPDMPSEADVAKDGVNLGEMNKLLLKKIEELTLYLIEKDEQLKKQQQEINNIYPKLK